MFILKSKARQKKYINLWFACKCKMTKEQCYQSEKNNHRGPFCTLLIFFFIGSHDYTVEFKKRKHYC